MSEHELKTWPEPFAAVRSDEKLAEFRRDDREPRFAVGDVLVLREWEPDHDNGTTPRTRPIIHTRGHEGTLLNEALDYGPCETCGASTANVCHTNRHRITKPHARRPRPGWDGHGFTVPAPPGRYTGEVERRVVTHVARGPHIPAGYAMLSMRRLP